MSSISDLTQEEKEKAMDLVDQGWSKQAAIDEIINQRSTENQEQTSDDAYNCSECNCQINKNQKMYTEIHTCSPLCKHCYAKWLDENNAQKIKKAEVPDDWVPKSKNQPVEEPKTEIVDEKTEHQSHSAAPSSNVPASLPNRSGDIVRPAVSAQDALAAWQEFQSLKHSIIDTSDLQKIQGNDYIKKSGWRKFATFYNLTDEIVFENREARQNEFIWTIKVRCYAPNGRFTEGVAKCSSKEKSGNRLEHDVYSTAHTRAKNRAISDMIAAGEVSAEEIA